MKLRGTAISLFITTGKNIWTFQKGKKITVYWACGTLPVLGRYILFGGWGILLILKSTNKNLDLNDNITCVRMERVHKQPITLEMLSFVQTKESSFGLSWKIQLLDEGKQFYRLISCGCNVLQYESIKNRVSCLKNLNVCWESHVGRFRLLRIRIILKW